ncbi:MAG TPA: hypothetical protein VHO70_06140 [Chitinispirillaceae bacterium]|nr:hypothetical protein [Chitinispirillaceae bacterium]
MNSKNINFFIVLIVVIFTDGCFTSMGLFRGANAIGKRQYEISPRWQTNTGIQAIGLNFRYGLTDINDIEIFGIGLLTKNDSGMFIPEIGIQGAITTQLFKLDWLAFGGQGFISTFNKYGGLRTIIGKKCYIGYEINYVLDDEFYLMSHFISHNLFIGGEQRINTNIFTSHYLMVNAEFGLQYLPFEDKLNYNKPNIFLGISLKFLKM